MKPTTKFTSFEYAPNPACICRLACFEAAPRFGLVVFRARAGGKLHLVTRRSAHSAQPSMLHLVTALGALGATLQIEGQDAAVKFEDTQCTTLSSIGVTPTSL